MPRWKRFSSNPEGIGDRRGSVWRCGNGGCPRRRARRSWMPEHPGQLADRSRSDLSTPSFHDEGRRAQCAQTAGNLRHGQRLRAVLYTVSARADTGDVRGEGGRGDRGTDSLARRFTAQRDVALGRGLPGLVADAVRRVVRWRDRPGRRSPPCPSSGSGYTGPTGVPPCSGCGHACRRRRSRCWDPVRGRQDCQRYGVRLRSPAERRVSHETRPLSSACGSRPPAEPVRPRKKRVMSWVSRATRCARSAMSSSAPKSVRVRGRGLERRHDVRSDLWFENPASFSIISPRAGTRIHSVVRGLSTRPGFARSDRNSVLRGDLRATPRPEVYLRW